MTALLKLRAKKEASAAYFRLRVRLLIEYALIATVIVLAALSFSQAIMIEHLSKACLQ